MLPGGCTGHRAACAVRSLCCPLCVTHRQTGWLFFLRLPAACSLPLGDLQPERLCSEVSAYLSDKQYTIVLWFFLHENQFRKLKVFGDQLLFQYEFKLCIRKLSFHDHVQWHSALPPLVKQQSSGESSGLRRRDGHGCAARRGRLGSLAGSPAAVAAWRGVVCTPLPFSGCPGAQGWRQMRWAASLRS